MNDRSGWPAWLMPPLHVFALPLPPNGPPPGYGWADRDMSAMSSLTAFRTRLEGRDRFLGENRCVVCGVGNFQLAILLWNRRGMLWVEKAFMLASLRLMWNIVEGSQASSLDPNPIQKPPRKWTTQWSDNVSQSSLWLWPNRFFIRYDPQVSLALYDAWTIEPSIHCK